MSKLIYITEAQLNEIIGNGAYLNNQDNTNEYRLGGAEISADGTLGDYVDGDLKFGNPVTTDRISSRLSKPRIRGIGTTVSRRVLPESNQELSGKNKTMQISKNSIDKLKDNLNTYNGDMNAPGVKRAKNIIKKGRISNDDGYRILDDFSKNKTGNILDDSLEKEIRKKLDTAENISQNNRDGKMERGENVLKSAPKTGLKGGAHTPKTKNIIDITYQ